LGLSIIEARGEGEPDQKSPPRRGRRIAERQVNLSIAQVAERAGMATHYLAFTP
jgi:hypothetical protein